MELMLDWTNKTKLIFVVNSNRELDEAVAAHNLGQLILKYRTINDLSQTAFGLKLWKKVSHASVSRWEKGKQLPDRDNLKNLARILEKSYDELNSLIEDPQLDLDKVDVPNLQLLTPNKHHFRLLKQGVKVWNRWREKHPDIIPELAGLDLRRCTLDGINLSRADLRKANIRASFIRNANFERANLSEADLDTVCFDNSHFNDADLRQSTLNWCKLNDVWLKRVNFTQSSINAGEFNCSCLYQSCFDSARLTNMDLRNANFNQTSWNKASVSDANILGASFEGVNWKDVEQECISMRSDNYVIQVSNLAFASLVYMEQHHLSVLERYIQERKIKLEVKDLVYELLDKYGSKPNRGKSNLDNDFVDCEEFFLGYIGPSENSIFCSCVISDPRYVDEAGEQIYLQYFIARQPNLVEAGYIVRSNRDTWKEGVQIYHLHPMKSVIEIKNDVINYNVHPQDLEDLKKVRTLITEKQTELIFKFIPIAKEIFRALRETSFQDRKYTLTRHEDDFVLRHTRNKDNSIMEINLTDDLLKIERSALKTKHLRHFQKVLDKLKHSNNT